MHCGNTKWFRIHKHHCVRILIIATPTTKLSLLIPNANYITHSSSFSYATFTPYVRIYCSKLVSSLTCLSLKAIENETSAWLGQFSNDPRVPGSMIYSCTYRLCSYMVHKGNLTRPVMYTVQWSIFVFPNFLVSHGVCNLSRNCLITVKYRVRLSGRNFLHNLFCWCGSTSHS